jgi:hypothetical protein
MLALACSGPDRLTHPGPDPLDGSHQVFK